MHESSETGIKATGRYPTQSVFGCDVLFCAFPSAAVRRSSGRISGKYGPSVSSEETLIPALKALEGVIELLLLVGSRGDLPPVGVGPERRGQNTAEQSRHAPEEPAGLCCGLKHTKSIFVGNVANCNCALCCANLWPREKIWRTR